MERYLRVNLLEPGPRLMKKEFTGPRSHKGSEPLLWALHSPTQYPPLQNILIAATHCYRKAHSPQTDPSFPIPVPFPSPGSLCHPDDADIRFLQHIRHIQNIAIVQRWFRETLFENQRHSYGFKHLYRFPDGIPNWFQITCLANSRQQAVKTSQAQI